MQRGGFHKGKLLCVRATRSFFPFCACCSYVRQEEGERGGREENRCW